MKKVLHSTPFSMESEKELQVAIHERLKVIFQSIKREVHLDQSNIIDFMVENNIGIEVKLKGSKKDIYYQCERYTKFKEIETLVLITGKSMTLPEKINGKKCVVINLSRAWL